MPKVNFYPELSKYKNSCLLALSSPPTPTTGGLAPSNTNAELVGRRCSQLSCSQSRRCRPGLIWSSYILDFPKERFEFCFKLSFPLRVDCFQDAILGSENTSPCEWSGLLSWRDPQRLETCF